MRRKRPKNKPAPFQPQTDYFQTAAFVTLSGITILVPVAMVQKLYLADVTPKLLLLVSGVCLLWIFIAYSSQLVLTFDSRLLPVLGALAVVTILATAFSSFPVLSLVGNYARRLGLPAILSCLALAAAVPLVAGDYRRRRKLLSLMVAAGVVLAAYALVQWFGKDPWIDPALYRSGEGAASFLRPPGTMGNGAYLSSYLLFVLFAAAGLLVTAQRSVEKTAWTAGAVLIFLAIFVCGVRGAWLGGLVGAVVLVRGLKQRRILWRVGIGFLLLALPLMFSPYGRQFRTRLQYMAIDPQGGARLWLWRDTLRMAIQHPLLGIGPDTFERNFPLVESKAMAQRFPDTYFSVPHNVVLDYLTEGGIFAGLALVLLAFWALRNYHRAACSVESEGPRYLARSLLGGLAAVLVAQQFISDTIPIRMIFFVAVGMSFSAPKCEPDFPPEISNTSARLRVWIGSFAALGLVLSLYYGGRLLEGDIHMHRAKVAAAQGDVRSVVFESSKAHESFPWDGYYAFAVSRTLGIIATKQSRGPSRAFCLAQAEKAGRAALPAVESPQLAAVELAILYAADGKLDDCENALRAAIRAAPQWYRPHWNLAELLIQRGRSTEAIQEADLALDLVGNNEPDVRERCMAIKQGKGEATRKHSDSTKTESEAGPQVTPTPANPD